LLCNIGIVSWNKNKKLKESSKERRSTEGKKRRNEEEKKKENGTNGRYLREAWYNDCPHMKSFCGGSRGAVFSKRAPLAAGGIFARTSVGNFLSFSFIF
jgi:hypothetical protein